MVGRIVFDKTGCDGRCLEQTLQKKKKKVMVSEEKRADPFRQADLMKYIAFSDS